MPTNVNVCTPRHETGDVSYQASAAVTGKRFLKVTGNRTGGIGLSTDARNVYVMGPCTAGARASGGQWRR